MCMSFLKQNLCKGIVSETVVSYVSSVCFTIAVVILWIPVIITVADYQVLGVHDVTSLGMMPWFDIVLGMVPDYMHGCLLVVTKTLLYKWFSATNHKKPYFIGGQVL